MRLWITAIVLVTLATKTSADDCVVGETPETSVCMHGRCRDGYCACDDGWVDRYCQNSWLKYQASVLTFQIAGLIVSTIYCVWFSIRLAAIVREQCQRHQEDGRQRSAANRSLNQTMNLAICTLWLSCILILLYFVDPFRFLGLFSAPVANAFILWSLALAIASGYLIIRVFLLINSKYTSTTKKWLRVQLGLAVFWQLALNIQIINIVRQPDLFVAPSLRLLFNVTATLAALTTMCFCIVYALRVLGAAIKMAQPDSDYYRQTVKNKQSILRVISSTILITILVVLLPALFLSRPYFDMQGELISAASFRILELIIIGYCLRMVKSKSSSREVAPSPFERKASQATNSTTGRKASRVKTDHQADNAQLRDGAKATAASHQTVIEVQEVP